MVCPYSQYASQKDRLSIKIHQEKDSIAALSKMQQDRKKPVYLS